jgi:hypothetical protein
MGRSSVFGYALWAAAQDLVMAVGHKAKPITTAQNYTTVFKKLALSFKGGVILKSVFI